MKLGNRLDRNGEMYRFLSRRDRANDIERTIVEKGVLRQETACPSTAYLEELKKTGIEVIIEEKNLEVSRF